MAAAQADVSLPPNRTSTQTAAAISTAAGRSVPVTLVTAMPAGHSA